MRRLLTGAIALVACRGTSVRAQSANGALFLLNPIGGRAVGMGQAVVSDTLGSESMWWNPGALARLSKTDLTLQGSRDFVNTGTAITFARPSARLGTVGVGIVLFDAGTQPLTSPTGVELGEIAFRNWILAASYATTVGRRAEVGLTYKFFQTRFDCQGICDIPVSRSGSSAVDVGARVTLPTASPIALGIAVRNIGPSFQVNDRAQADPIPLAVQAGLSTEIRAVARRSEGVRLRVSSDLFTVPTDRAVSWRTGAELGYRDRVAVRGGWSVQSGVGGGPSLGVSGKVDRLVFDLGLILSGLSVDQGQSPAYVSLRFPF